MSTPHKHQIPEWALNRLRNYCAYQERCIMDVKIKLEEFHLHDNLNEAIINKLIEENYLDEERYARIFAGGKFRINKWGKNKIYHALEQKKVPELYILEGLNEIEDEEYLSTLRMIINQKRTQLKESDLSQRNKKLANFAIARGFEQNLVWNVLKERI